MGSSIITKRNNPSDFKTLFQYFSRIPAKRKLFQDGVLTKAELTSLFDLNGNHHVEMADMLQLKKIIGLSRFTSLGKIFRRHGLNIYERAEDITQYIVKNIYSRTGSSTIDKDLKVDPQFIESMMTRGHAALIPPALKSSRSFWMRIVTRYGGALKWAPSQIRSDRTIVLTAIKQGKGSLIHAANNLQKDKSFVLQAVAANPLALAYAVNFYHDRDVVLKAVNGNGYALRWADDKAKTRRICLAAVKNNHHAFKYLPPRYKKDPVFIVQAAKTALSGKANYLNDSLAINIDYPAIRKKLFKVHVISNLLKLLLPHLVKNKKIAMELAKINFLIIALLPPHMKKEIWGTFVASLYRRNIRFPRRMMTSFDVFIKSMRSITKYSLRMRSIETLYELWKARMNIASIRDRRPLVIMIFPKSDSNNAFTANRLVEKLVASRKFRVLYFEADNEQAIRKILARATLNGKRKPHKLFLAGHGQPNKLHLSGGSDKDERRAIDIADIKAGEFDYLRKLLHPTCKIFLFSCSTGKGSWKNYNLTNALASRLPRTMKLESPTEDTNILDVRIVGTRIVITWGLKLYNGGATTVFAQRYQTAGKL